MFCLLYVSFATRRMSDADLVELAAQSARDNRILDVTGILMYEDGIFLQVLEGDRDVVRDLMQKIVEDKRHERLAVLLEEDVERRHFPDWHMALADPSMMAEEDRQMIRHLARTPPAIPETRASPSITRLMNTFLKVVRLGRPEA